MIILCAGMSRSGSTLQYQLIKGLVESQGVGYGYGSWNIKNVLENKNDDRYRVYKSEPWLYEYQHLINHAFSIIRNPFDVVISLYRFRLAKEYYACTGRPITLRSIIDDEMFRIMQWIQWWEYNGAYIIRYEDVFPDNINLILQQAAEIFCLTMTDKEEKYLVETCSIDNNLEKIAEQKQWFDFTDSMLTLGHIGPNAGKPGEWKKLLGESEKEAMMPYCEEFMCRHGYL